VGDREFQRSLEFPAWRVVNDTDIVTRAPFFGFLQPLQWPFARRYHPVGELKFIDENGDIGPTEVVREGRIHLLTYLSAKLRRTRKKFANHSPLRYTILIWNNYADRSRMKAAAALETTGVYEKPKSRIWKWIFAALVLMVAL